MRHESVLLQECVRYLDIDPAGIYVDGTLGMGGHAEAVAQKLTSGLLIGIDRDDRALASSRERLAGFGNKVRLVKGSFGDLSQILDSLGVSQVNGMLFDLGVSSPQLDDKSRGFSYMQDAPLDMRMDETAPLTARDVLNTYSEAELRSIFWRYGEERYAGRIAEAVVAARQTTPLETTGQFVEIIRSTSFHSLEDRLVKEAIRKRENGCTCPPDFPVCTCGFVKTLRSVTRKPVIPGGEELARNPRARSARLRIAEKV